MRGCWVQILYKSYDHRLRNRLSSKAFQLKTHHFFRVTLMSRFISRIIASKIPTQCIHILYQMIAQWFLNMASKFEVITLTHFGTRAWRMNSIKKRFNSAFQFIEERVSYLRVYVWIGSPLHAVFFGSCLKWGIDLSTLCNINLRALNSNLRSKMTCEQDLYPLPSNQASKNNVWECFLSSLCFQHVVSERYFHWSSNMIPK